MTLTKEMRHAIDLVTKVACGPAIRAQPIIYTEEERVIRREAIALVRTLLDAPDEGEEKIFRRLLATNHGCKYGLYTDDGELSCPHCKIDFLRDPPSNIEAALFRRGSEKLRSLPAPPAPEPAEGKQ